MRSASYYTDAALSAFNAGFSSKAAQQAALSDVNRAYDLTRDKVQQACLDARDGNFEMSAEMNKVYWDVPSYPHQFKAKHVDLIRAAFGDALDAAIMELEALVELRNTIKAAAIVPPVKAEPSPVEKRIRETIEALMARRKEQFLTAIDLSTVLGDRVMIKGLTANSHWVHNEHGTRFIRTFYYLNGKLTPLNVIIAAAEEAARRAEA